MEILFFNSNSELDNFLLDKEYQEVQNGNGFWIAFIDGDLIKCVIDNIFE